MLPLFNSKLYEQACSAEVKQGAGSFGSCRVEFWDYFTGDNVREPLPVSIEHVSIFDVDFHSPACHAAVVKSSINGNDELTPLIYQREVNKFRITPAFMVPALDRTRSARYPSFGQLFDLCLLNKTLGIIN